MPPMPPDIPAALPARLITSLTRFIRSLRRSPWPPFPPSPFEAKSGENIGADWPCCAAGEQGAQPELVADENCVALICEILTDMLISSIKAAFYERQICDGTTVPAI